VNQLNPIHSAVWQLREEIAGLKVCKLRSRIVPHFPPLFEEFRAKCSNLLWRGSRDGFGAAKFHRRCDGSTNTLLLIPDSRGNVFGGSTPVKSESGYSGDNSLRNFLFTLKNPRHFTFAQKTPKRGLRCARGR
jgi:hypothetical protein